MCFRLFLCDKNVVIWRVFGTCCHFTNFLQVKNASLFPFFIVFHFFCCRMWFPGCLCGKFMAHLPDPKPETTEANWLTRLAVFTWMSTQIILWSMWKNRHVFFANSHPVANISLLLACAKQAWKFTGKYFMFTYNIECIFLSERRHYDSFPDFTPSSDDILV